MGFTSVLCVPIGRGKCSVPGSRPHSTHPVSPQNEGGVWDPSHLPLPPQPRFPLPPLSHQAGLPVAAGKRKCVSEKSRPRPALALKCIQPVELGEQLTGEPHGCASGAAMGRVMRTEEKPNTGALWKSGAPPFYILYLGCLSKI